MRALTACAEVINVASGWSAGFNSLRNTSLGYGAYGNVVAAFYLCYNRDMFFAGGIAGVAV